MTVSRLFRIPRFTVRQLMVAICAISVGMAICVYPIASLRSAHRLRDGTTICFYNQYRLWPGSRRTHCLEVVSRSGESRTYPFAVNAGVQFAEPRWNADQSIIWLVDFTTSRSKGQVLCSLNRKTGRFVGYGGEHPAPVAAE